MIRVFSIITALMLTSAPVYSQGMIGDKIPAEVKAMYKKGLKYMSGTQNPDGSWGKSSYNAVGITAICLMAFMGSGEDTNSGPYSKNIKKAVGFLINKQQSNGYIGTSMYNHGFATLALAEAYGHVPDKKLGPVVQKAVKLIVGTQNSLGAWRYSPGSTSGDTTIVGCQVMALFAARNAGIAVPDKTFKAAIKYLKGNQDRSGAFGYTSQNSRKDVALTAIGSLCISINGENSSKRVKSATSYINKNGPIYSSHPYYSRYYISQALFQADTISWKRWSKVNIKLLKYSQLSNGAWTHSYGMDFATGFPLLSMALHYRFLPVYERN